MKPDLDANNSTEFKFTFLSISAFNKIYRIRSAVVFDKL